MNVAYPFHDGYLMLYARYRSLADYSRKSCLSIYHPNVNDDSTLMISKYFDNFRHLPVFSLTGIFKTGN